LIFENKNSYVVARAQCFSGNLRIPKRSVVSIKSEYIMKYLIIIVLKEVDVIYKAVVETSFEKDLVENIKSLMELLEFEDIPEYTEFEEFKEALFVKDIMLDVESLEQVTLLTYK